MIKTYLSAEWADVFSSLGDFELFDDFPERSTVSASVQHSFELSTVYGILAQLGWKSYVHCADRRCIEVRLRDI